MSRHIIELEDGKEIAYGHDHAVGYFFQVFDGETDDGEDNLVINEDSVFTQMSNGRMMELMIQHGAPEEHVALVGSDLPI
jgi:hypothetical protein